MNKIKRNIRKNKAKFWSISVYIEDRNNVYSVGFNFSNIRVSMSHQITKSLVGICKIIFYKMYKKLLRINNVPEFNIRYQDIKIEKPWTTLLTPLYRFSYRYYEEPPSKDAHANMLYRKEFTAIDYEFWKFFDKFHKKSKDGN